MKYDSGYAWIILLMAFLSNTIYCAVSTSPTLFLVNISENFGVSTYQAGWICSVNGFLLNTASIGCGVLIDKFSCRTVGFIGSILVTISLIVASMVDNLFLFIIAFSVIFGFFLSFLKLPPIVVIQMYFDKKRAFANGMALTGYSAGVFIFLPLIGWFIKHYGWKGALLLVGGMALNTCVCMLTFLPIEQHKESNQSLDNKMLESNRNINGSKQHSLLTILSDITFILVAVSFSLFFFGGDFMFKVSTPRAELDLGLDKVSASLVTSVMSGGGLISRIVCSLLLNVSFIKPTVMYACSILAGGLIIIMCSFVSSYRLMLITAGAYGVVFGITHTVQTTILVDLLGTDVIARSQGLLGGMTAICFLLTIPFAGLMYDLFGSFSSACFIAGVVQCLGGITALVLLIKTLRQDKLPPVDDTAQKGVLIQVDNKVISHLRSNPVLMGSIESLSCTI